MKLVFMGTPEFARRPLEYLYKNTAHEILAVVTGPDKPSGRGLKMVPTAVKTAALALDLPCFTPQSLKNLDFIAEMKNIGADIFVVVAFRILPESLYSIPQLGSINVHGSLLPKYRGAAPINWALINGETETGLTAFFLKKKVDTGDIIYQEETPILPEESFDELYFRLSNLAGPVIDKTLNIISSPDFIPSKQEEHLVTPAPKLGQEDCLIDWGFPARNVVNFVRGLSSTPGAYTDFHGRKLKIFRACEVEFESPDKFRPGQIINDKNRLLVATAKGAVEILELLPEGKTRISGNEFLRGYRPNSNDILGARSNEEISKK
jgi:methionyl-tRNA formyltransferase